MYFPPTVTTHDHEPQLIAVVSIANEKEAISVPKDIQGEMTVSPSDSLDCTISSMFFLISALATLWLEPPATGKLKTQSHDGTSRDILKIFNLSSSEKEIGENKERNLATQL